MLKSKEILIKKRDEVSKHMVSIYHIKCFKFNNIYYTMYPHFYKIHYFINHNTTGIYRFIEDTFFIQIDTPIPYL